MGTYKNQWHNISLAERFWANVNKNGPTPKHCPELGPCWLWTGARVSNRYGQIRVDGKSSLAHRVAWYLQTGRWPKNNACHKCDNEQCVRFSHLFDATQKENVKDMDTKQRGFRGETKKGERCNFAKLTEPSVKKIRALAGKLLQKEIAKRFQVSQTLVSQIVRRKIWSHI